MKLGLMYRPGVGLIGDVAGTKSVAPAVTVVPKMPVTKSKTVTQTVTPKETVTGLAKGGRGKKVHSSVAEKQAAYRARKKAMVSP